MDTLEPGAYANQGAEIRSIEESVRMLGQEQAMLPVEQSLREEITARLDLMLRDARKGDVVRVPVLGSAIEAELRRLITPVGVHARNPQKRPLAALQMGLTVAGVQEVRTLVLKAITVFSPEDRQATVQILNQAIAQWRKM